MIRRALLTAALASLLTEPVIAHDTIRNAGTEDAAIRTQDGYVQLSDLAFHYAHRDDPGYRLYEDGSASVISHDGCYQDTSAGRVALRDC